MIIIISNANRGMQLETILNKTAQIYKEEGVCLFQKRPVAVKCLIQNKGKITKGFFAEKSTCDYYGIYKGAYFEFEAKETMQKRLSLANIKDHQIIALQTVVDHGGKSGIIVNFKITNQYFFLSTRILQDFINQNVRKSIPLDFFIKKGHELFLTHGSKLDFIDALFN